MTQLINKLIYQHPSNPGVPPVYHQCFLELHCSERLPRLADFQYVQSLGALLELNIPDHDEGLRCLSFSAMPVPEVMTGLVRDPDGDAHTALCLLAPEYNPAQALYAAGSMDLVVQLVGSGRFSNPALNYVRANPYIRLGVGLRAAERVGAELESILVQNTHPNQRGFMVPGQLSAVLGDLCVVGAMAAVLITNTTEQMLMQSPGTSKAGHAFLGSRLGCRIRSALDCLAQLWVVTRAAQLTCTCDEGVFKEIIGPDTARTFGGGNVRDQLLRDMDTCGVPQYVNGVSVFEPSGMWHAWDVRTEHGHLPRQSAWAHRFGTEFLEDNDPQTWWSTTTRPPVLVRACLSEAQGA